MSKAPVYSIASASRPLAVLHHDGTLTLDPDVRARVARALERCYETFRRGPTPDDAALFYGLAAHTALREWFCIALEATTGTAAHSESVPEPPLPGSDAADPFLMETHRPPLGGP